MSGWGLTGLLLALYGYGVFMGWTVRGMSDRGRRR